MKNAFQGPDTLAVSKHLCLLGQYQHGSFEKDEVMPQKNQRKQTLVICPVPYPENCTQAQLLTTPSL